jgi:hypothetical protein
MTGGLQSAALFAVVATTTDLDRLTGYASEDRRHVVCPPFTQGCFRKGGHGCPVPLLCCC